MSELPFPLASLGTDGAAAVLTNALAVLLLVLVLLRSFQRQLQDGRSPHTVPSRSVPAGQVSPVRRRPPPGSPLD
jgi:uncharacterized protein (DUF58 family)